MIFGLIGSSVVKTVFPTSAIPLRKRLMQPGAAKTSVRLAMKHFPQDMLHIGIRTGGTRCLRDSPERPRPLPQGCDTVVAVDSHLAERIHKIHEVTESKQQKHMDV